MRPVAKAPGGAKERAAEQQSPVESPVEEVRLNADQPVVKPFDFAPLEPPAADPDVVPEVFVEPHLEQVLEQPMRPVREGAGTENTGDAGASPSAPAAARATRESLLGKIVCPFCGQQKSTSAEPCPRCTMEDTPATRQATKARIGPWYVLQNRSPSAPGMKYATLLWLVNKGHITPRSIVRGPTTYQLWRYAAHVRGLSREFGLCYSCGGEIEKSVATCPHCERPQEAPTNPDALLDARDGVAAGGAGAAGVGVGAPVGGPRQPVMREVEARRTPKMDRVRDEEAEDDGGFEDPDQHDPARREVQEVAAAVGAAAAATTEPSHSERLRARNEMIVRQRQELLRRGDGRMVSGMDLAAALQDPGDAPPRSRRWSILNVILFFLVLFGGAGAAVLYLKPEYRAPTASWTRETWGSVRGKLASMQWSSPPGESPAKRVATKPDAPQQNKPVATNVQPSNPTPPPIVETKPEPQPEQPVRVAKQDAKRDTASPPPTTEPSAQLARNDVSPSAQPQPEPRQRQEQPQPETRQPDPQARPRESQAQRRPDREPAERDRTRREDEHAERPAPQPEVKSIDRAVEEARTLWGQAIDAEARQDFPAAVRYYEQIKQLPKGAWPGGLQVALDLARKRSQGRSAQAQ